MVETRSGFCSEGSALVTNSQEFHLRMILGLMGITNIAFLRAERLAFEPESNWRGTNRAEVQGRLGMGNGSDR